MHSLSLNIFKLIGFLFLFLSILNPWFSTFIDSSTLGSSLDYSALDISILDTTESTSSYLYRFFSFFVFLLLLPFERLFPLEKLFPFKKIFTAKLSIKKHSIKILSLYLFLIFFFPLATMTLNPDSYANATWLDVQHKNISWLGGDIFTTQEYANFSSRRRLQIIEPASELEVFRLPYLNSNLLSLGGAMELLEWLGYSSAFCQFFSKGYAYAFFGTLILLLCCLSLGRLSLESFNLMSSAKEIVLYSLIPTLLLLSFVFLWILFNSFKINQAQSLTAKLEFRDALAVLNTVEKNLAPISYNTSFLYQKSALNYFIDKHSKQALLYRVLNEKNTSKAIIEAKKAIEEGSSQEKLELIRFLLRVAISKYNSGSTIQAKELFDFITSHQASNIKANFVLQLIALERSDAKDSSRNNVKEIESLVLELKQIYSKMNTRGAKPVIAFCMENLALAKLNAGKPQEAIEILKKRLR